MVFPSQPEIQSEKTAVMCPKMLTCNLFLILQELFSCTLKTLNSYTVQCLC